MAQSVVTAGIGSFRLFSARAILARCLGTAHPRATAPQSANCRPNLYVVPGPWPRLGRPVKHDVATWRVVDDWPAYVPVMDDEVRIIDRKAACSEPLPPLRA
jgi:hypothetical protein